MGINQKQKIMEIHLLESVSAKRGIALKFAEGKLNFYLHFSLRFPTFRIRLACL